MFLLEDSRCQMVRIILIPYRYGLLENNRAAVEFGGYQMNGHSRMFHAMLPRLVLRVHPWKRWEQGRVNIQDRVRKGVDKDGAEKPHEAGKTNKPDAAGFELLHQLAVIIFARGKFCLVPVIEDHRLDARLRGSLQPGGVAPV
jgi:hypothetical protein